METKEEVVMEWSWPRGNGSIGSTGWRRYVATKLRRHTYPREISVLPHYFFPKKAILMPNFHCKHRCTHILCWGEELSQLG